MPSPDPISPYNLSFYINGSHQWTNSENIVMSCWGLTIFTFQTTRACRAKIVYDGPDVPMLVYNGAANHTYYQFYALNRPKPNPVLNLSNPMTYQQTNDIILNVSDTGNWTVFLYSFGYQGFDQCIAWNWENRRVQTTFSPYNIKVITYSDNKCESYCTGSDVGPNYGWAQSQPNNICHCKWGYLWDTTAKACIKAPAVPGSEGEGEDDS